MGGAHSAGNSLQLGAGLNVGMERESLRLRAGMRLRTHHADIVHARKHVPLRTAQAAGGVRRRMPLGGHAT